MFIRLRHLLALSVSIACCSSSTYAQIELGAHLGHGYYMGDLQPEATLAPLGNGKPSFGMYARTFLGQRFAMTANVTSTKISGDDRRRTNTMNRNLSFSSDLLEIGLAGEVYPLGTDRSMTPYLSAGVAVYRFNPQTEFNGRTIDLQPLGTEGQGMDGFAEKYSLTRLALPVGAGVRIPFGQSWVIGAEIILRATFFDHLDDVSGAYVNYYELVQGNGSLAGELADRTNERLGLEPRDIPSGTPRGNIANFDWYATAGLTVGYRLGSGMFSGSNGAGAGRYNKCYRF